MTVPEEILSELREIRNLLGEFSPLKGAARGMLEGVEAYDVQKVSELFAISPSTVRRYAQAGKLPHFKLGDKYMFPVEKLCEWIEREVEENNNFIAEMAGEVNLHKLRKLS